MDWKTSTRHPGSTLLAIVILLTLSSCKFLIRFIYSVQKEIPSHVVGFQTCKPRVQLHPGCTGCGATMTFMWNIRISLWWWEIFSKFLILLVYRRKAQRGKRRRHLLAYLAPNRLIWWRKYCHLIVVLRYFWLCDVSKACIESNSIRCRPLDRFTIKRNRIPCLSHFI